MKGLRVFRACALVVALAAMAPPASAADKIIGGTLGGQAPLWPFYIAPNEGMLKDQNIDLELNFAPSPSGVVTQLTSGSIDVAVSTGLDDPIQAIDRGAPLAIVRIIGEVAPYALVADKSVKTIADLKGKTVSSGSTVDITTVFLDRMTAASGLKAGDYDIISAGVAAARFAALKAGAANAAMLLPPLNFRAEQAGFHTIGLVADYVHDFPFTCMAVNRDWAKAHPDLLKRLVAATDKAIAWFDDPANRQAAIDLLVNVAHAERPDAEASYAYLQKLNYFERSPKVSRSRLDNLLKVEAERKLTDEKVSVDKVILPGLTQMTD